MVAIIITISLLLYACYLLLLLLCLSNLRIVLYICATTIIATISLALLSGTIYLFHSLTSTLILLFLLSISLLLQLLPLPITFIISPIGFLHFTYNNIKSFFQTPS